MATTTARLMDGGTTLGSNDMDEEVGIKATRLKGWDDNLHALIVARREAPFEWGQHDCCLWVGDAVLAMTGFDPAEEYRGAYSTALGAKRKMFELDGVETPEALADKVFGERLPIAFARIGDIVVADPEAVGFLSENGTTAMGKVLGICYGRTSLFVGSEENHHGLITLRTLGLEWCYRV